MKTIKTQVHTIFMLLGPSGSGKTTFAKKVLIPSLDKPFNVSKNFKPNIQYISSEIIRKELIGYDEIDNFEDTIREINESVFKILFTKLELVSSYPINATYIILDTTALNDNFRNKVIEIAKKNNYNIDVIVFDYKKIEEYTKNFDNFNVKGKDIKIKTVVTQVKRLRHEVLKTIKKDVYTNITKIKEKDFIREYTECGFGRMGYLVPLYTFEVCDFDKYEQNILSNEYAWIIIGDVHGCIIELKELFIKFGFEINDNELKDTNITRQKGLIFVGDLIDKSSENNIESIIRFIHHNMDIFGERLQLVMGNHEEMVYKWINNDPTLEINEKRINEKDKFYNTVGLLEKNDELKKMFLDIFSKMKGWVKNIGQQKNNFIVTHAPCKIKYLEKMNKPSLMKQIKCLSRSKNKDKTHDELTPYLIEEANQNHALHIFGHLDQPNIRSYKNKVCIDTGCIYGNSLTGYCITPYKNITFNIKSKTFSTDYETTFNNSNTILFYEMMKKNIMNVNIDNLSESDQRRLNYIINNGIEYIGGTISPSNKDEITGELESLKTGLNYYKGKIETVILEPKYMGSRAQLYLNRDINKCYATSRNGYKINNIDLTKVFEQELKKHNHLMNTLEINTLILDGELMPWAALGEGLIDKHFRLIDKAIKSEIDFLKENNFDESFNVLVNQWKESNYDSIKNTTPKAKLKEQFGHAYNNYKILKDEYERWQSIDKHLEYWKIYNEQIQLYGCVDEEIEYKPFRILKAKKIDDTQINITFDTLEQFILINSDSVHIVNFNEVDYQEKAEMWFNDITINKKLEGCVIKPLNYNTNLAPYMKVRNDNYLTIIYGYDMYFPKKFNTLIKQKNIKRKLNASKIEYNLGEQMLNVNSSSQEFKQIVANFMFENEKEKNIDPRL